MPVKPGSDAVDLTVVAVPGYFAAMGVEYLAATPTTGPGRGPDGRRLRDASDTLASLAMGSLSLLAPFVVPRLLRPVTRGQRPVRQGRSSALAAGAAVVTTVADVVARRSERRAARTP